MGDARLKWGNTPLLPDGTTDSLSYKIEASADGTSWGNPQAVVTEIRSHLQDGSLASVTSQDNRQGTVKVRVSSLTYDGLDAGGQALAAETRVQGYSTLYWTPSVSLAVPTVFDVVYSTLAWEFDDLQETKVGNGVISRYFAVTLELLPFGRDVSLTTVLATSASTAPVTSPTITSVDNCSAINNWATTAGTLQTASGKLYVDLTSSPPVNTVWSNSGTFYSVAGANRIMVLDYSLVQVDGGSTPPDLVIAGVGFTTALATLLQVGPYATAGVGYYRAFYSIPAGAPSSVGIALIFKNPAPFTRISLDQVSTATALPLTGTNRERTRSITVGGSARARASLSITADAGKTLGDLTMLYTRVTSNGLQPGLRPFRVAGSTVTSGDATALASLSGAYNALGTAMVFNIPASRFKEAAHDLVLRLRATTLGTYTITWTAVLASSANADIPETALSITGTTTVTFPAANTWQTNEVGLLQLPTVPVAPDSTHMIRLTIVASSSVVQIDQGWLFDLDNGVLSWINTTGVTRLEARTADLTNPEPSYWAGTVDAGPATALVRADWRVVSYGQHRFDPGTVDVFTVTSGTEGSSCSATYYRSWLHSAAA